MTTRLCVVCQERGLSDNAFLLCKPCIKSWLSLRDDARGTDIWWAARRTRFFERKRERAKAQRPEESK